MTFGEAGRNGLGFPDGLQIAFLASLADCAFRKLFVYRDALNNILTVDALADAIQYAADNGASVINVSQALTADHTLVRDAVNYATSKDALVICSAGIASLGWNIRMRPYRFSKLGDTSSDDHGVSATSGSRK